MPTTLADDDSEAAVTRELIMRQARAKTRCALARRLRQAAREMDLAAIFTIHGFCARALAEHALEAGQPLLAPELTGSERELIDAIATDLWRSLGADPVDAELLQAQWRTPEELAGDLAGCCTRRECACAARALVRSVAAVARRCRCAAHGLRVAWRRGLRGAGRRHRTKVLNETTYKKGLAGRADVRPRAMVRSSAMPRHRFDDRIDRLTPQTLADKTNKAKAVRR